MACPVREVSGSRNAPGRRWLHNHHSPVAGWLAAPCESNMMSLIRIAEDRGRYPVRCLRGFGQREIEHLSEELYDTIDIGWCNFREQVDAMSGGYDEAQASAETRLLLR